MAYGRSNLEAWDPMAESYHDANINSYENGPGEHLTPYARGQANTEYKLYVNNIPPELCEKGIQQVFNRYGQTLNVMSPPESSWAYVTFGSFREAEIAMRVLNNTPPLNLHISFARKNAEDSRKRLPRHGTPNIESLPQRLTVLENQPREYISPEQRQIIRPSVRNLGRGKEFAFLPRKAIAPPPGPGYGSDDLLYPVMDDPNFYNPYEELEPHSDTNTMWTRDRVQVANNGTRFVTMGRGHAWYELPTPHPKVHQQIQNVYENRTAGLYEFGENKFAQQVGKCQHCVQPASMRCQRCREFYCSRLCQETDWPRHKIECQPMPRLEGGLDSGSLSLSSGDDAAQEQVRASRTMRVPMRRPMRTAGPPMLPNFTSTPDPITFPDSGTSALIPTGTLEPKEKENKLFLTQDNGKRNHSGDQKAFVDQNKPANIGGWNPAKNETSKQIFPSHNSQGERPQTNQRANDFSMPPPPMHTNFQARQESREKLPETVEQHFQQARQDNKSFENRNGQNRSSGGQGYGSQFQSFGAQQNKNFFPRSGDRGNSEQKNHQQMREQVKNLSIDDTEAAKPVIKANITDIKSVKSKLPDPDLSFHKATDIPENSGVKSPTKVSFSRSSNDGAVAGPSRIQSLPKPVVNHVAKGMREQAADKTQVPDPLGPSISPREPGNETKSVIELLEVEDEGMFEVHVLLGSNKAAVTVCLLKVEDEYAKIMGDLTLECNNLPSIPNFKPSIGDLVCGKRQDDWIRGTVTSLGHPIRLAAIDEGRVEPVQAVRPVPSGFVNLPTFGAICELTEGSLNLEQKETYTFVVEKINPGSVSQDGVQIVVSSTDKKTGKGILKPWTPAPEQKGLRFATLTDGMEVIVVCFRSHAHIFARSCMPKDLEVFQRVTQDVARWSTKASPLTALPVVGEMVIARYAEDKNFYRAIVTKIQDNNIMVSYVDFGNRETTTLENLRPISPNLKEYPSCVAKIILKDVPKDVAMNKDVNQYLNQLTGEEKPCTIKSFTDGVVLKTADGTCVNDKIKELLIPSWQKKEDETTVFMLDDLNVAELGAVGTTSYVCALWSYGPLSYAMGPQDHELFGHIELMAAQMEQYCQQTTKHYIPRQAELCIAPFEGQWFRAACVETNTTSTTSTVMFIDFGNMEEVKHTDIRVMTKDFTTAVVFASGCSVVGLGPVDRNGELPEAVGNRVKELVGMNQPVLVKIVDCSKPGEYTVELPEVRETLIKEGLIKV